MVRRMPTRRRAEEREDLPNHGVRLTAAVVLGDRPQLLDVQRLRRPSHAELDLLRCKQRQSVAFHDRQPASLEGPELSRDRVDQDELQTAVG